MSSRNCAIVNVLSHSLSMDGIKMVVQVNSTKHSVFARQTPGTVFGEKPLVWLLEPKRQRCNEDYQILFTAAYDIVRIAEERRRAAHPKPFPGSYRGGR